MYGHGAAPPSRSSGTVITLRVLFTAAGFLTCGMLACIPLFRVAVLRGKWFDWALAWVSLPLAIGGLMVIGSLPESDPRTDVALGVVLLLGAFSAVYFLSVDIEHHRARPPFPGYVPQQPPPAGYGYPQPASPYTATHPQTPMQSTPVPQAPVPQTPVPQAPVPQTPVPPPAPPQRPTPVRIDQVRAELDELSDYLRKHEGNHEDGR
ncbi:hypothetical protein [Streptomyces sp. NBC_00620]|uniref:hypothetical protein n=1 Tax=Streptomyces sp. NBC_00620 TaxID=2903666 RepID=UPI00225208B5|nr:hypothetical protein [Streptomyces sp. NBC_00620]MCX4973843.1 hypothetical protein [Streptomyces sp. NBC_00620]